MAIENNEKVITSETLKVAYDALKSIIDNIVNNHTNNKNNPHNVTVEQIHAVPDTRTINGNPLSNDITLPVDNELSSDSENPVENRVVFERFSEMRQVPSCTESNNGQFLRVVSGSPTWQTVPNAEDNAF